MATEKVTQKSKASSVKSTASFVITQPEGESGSEVETLERASIGKIIAALQQNGLLSGLKTAKNIETTETGIRLNYWDDDYDDIPISSGGLAFDGGYVDNEGYLHLKSGDDEIEGFTPFFVGTGGGGSSAAGINLSSVVKPSSVINGGDAEFSFTATATDDTNITVVWYVDGVVRATESDKESGSTFRFNAKSYLKASDTSLVKAAISSESGATLNRQWNVTSSAFSLSWGSTIQPVTLYTENENVYIAVNVSAQSETRNYVTLSNGNASDDKTQMVTGSKSITFDADPEWFTQGVNTITATMVSRDYHETEDKTYNSSKTYYELNGSTYSEWDGDQDDWDERPTLYEKNIAEPIMFKAIWAVWGSGDTPAKIVAFNAAAQTGTQYETVPIKFLVYDPSNETSSCTLQVGSEDARSFTAGRSMQTFNYVPQDYGTKTVTLTCGSVSTTMTLAISQSQYSIGKVTENLIFNIDPAGHSNTDSDRASFGNFTLSPGFDWVNGGFQTDEKGAPAFVVKKGDTATLPRSLFGDADGNGKTIDLSFKIKNSDMYSAVAMQELNNGGLKGLELRANEGELRLNNSTGQLFRYCEDNRIDLSINIEGNIDRRVMTVWLDGVQSQVNTYATGTLVQNENSLVIGSDHCDVWVYAIRVYSISLSIKDMIQNYISYGSTTKEKVERYQRNNIFNVNNVITPETLHAACPELTIVHISAERISYNKKDDVSADITIRDGTNVLTLTKGDDGDKAKIKVQGTSSAAYGRSAYNLDIDFKKSSKTYSISSGAKGVNYLNIKVNVASSENANNICAADFYNTYQPYLVPARANAGVRDTVEGKPCAVFFTNDSANTIWVGSQQLQPQDTILYAMGDICNSKKNVEVFGQDGEGEHYCKGCIEVSGNDTAAQQFRASSTYVADADEGKGEWQTNNEGTVSKDYEWRVKPKSEDVSEVVTAWDNAVAWVVSTDTKALPDEGPYEALSSGVTIAGETYYYDSPEYRLAKFKAELGNYFAVDSLLYHFLYLEFFEAFDNVSKNTFYSYEWDSTNNKYLWNICKNYDDDTILGCDNDGFPLADYGADFGDKSGGRSLFNADSNPIWVNIQAAFSTELATMYVSLKGNGAWNATSIISKWDNYQNIRPHAAMAQDAYNKYILPYKTTNVEVGGETKSYDDSYLARLQGSKTYQRRQFITYQVKYMDGKYGYYSTADSIYFRGNADEGTTKDFTIGAYAKTYVTVIVDNGTKVKKKIETGGTAVFQNIAVHSNATVYVTPESLVTGITPLDEINNSTFSAAGASKLQGVVLGSSESTNTAWNANTGLNVPSAILKELSIRNLSNFAKSLDLSANVELESVDTRGTNAAIITLPSYAPITTIHLNACSGIIAANLNDVTTFSVAGGSNLTTIRVEDCNDKVNDTILDILTSAVNSESNATRRIRLTGVNWILNDGNMLYKIATTWKGYNALGNEIDTPVITGRIYIPVLSAAKKALFDEVFGEGVVTVTDQEVPSYTVTYKGYNSTTGELETIAEETVDEGESPVSTPSSATKPMTAEATYTFDGWSWTEGGSLISDVSALVITQNSTIYAHFSETAREYTVRHWSGTGPTAKGKLLKTQSVTYGSQATYPLFTETFSESSDTAYNGDKTYYYLNNGVQTVWEGGQAGWDARPTLYEKDGGIPVSPSNTLAGYYYMFIGWDKSTGCVSEDLDVYARYDRAQVPADRTAWTSTKSPLQLNAMVATGVLSESSENNNIVKTGDTVDIVLGCDKSYSNVVEHELVALGDTQTFDGSTNPYFKPQRVKQVTGDTAPTWAASTYYANTGTAASPVYTVTESEPSDWATNYTDYFIKEDFLLFDTDKSFTIAMDIQYSGTDANKTIMACYDDGGVVVKYDSGPRVIFSNGSEEPGQSAGSSTTRNMIVLRHKKGEKKLYVYGSRIERDTATPATETLNATLALTEYPETNAPLVLGATMYASGGTVVNKASGKVYWAKYWEADLGESDCLELAAWCRETYTFQAAGSGTTSDKDEFQTFKRDDNGHFVNCCFLMKDLLSVTHKMNQTGTNSGGWNNSSMRSWLNTRVWNALPLVWKEMILTVRVKSSAGGGTSSAPVTTIISPPATDKLWIPSCKDVNLNVTQEPYASESEAKITLFGTDSARIKKLNNGYGSASVWWLRSPNHTYSYYFWYVYTNGNGDYYNAGGSYGVAFGFCI